MIFYPHQMITVFQTRDGEIVAVVDMSILHTALNIDESFVTLQRVYKLHISPPFHLMIEPFQHPIRQ